ncbi:MAG TPA: molecular chaperone DnaJ [Acidimicrobiales bacterium]
MAPQREWFEKDYYKILGVADDASPKDITKAYRKLARQHHPDANPGDKAAEERFKEISAAYDVVGDEAKRKEYDEVRRLGPMGGGFGPGAGAPGGFAFSEGDLGDLLGGIFRTGGMRRGRGAASESGAGAGPRRGSDLEATLTMSFDDAAHGITTALQLTSDAACTTCNGSGAKPGTSPRVCQVCQGRGVTADNQGFFSFSKPCTVCQGQGTIVDSPCATCRGKGIERRPREVKVRIPAGVADGQRIRLKGRGAPGRNGGPPGDLYVECKVQPHPDFAREGDDLVRHVPITYAEAVLGADVTVRRLDGTPVSFKVRPGTRPGQRFRLKGHGIATDKGSGDLVAVVDLVVPSNPGSAERKVIEELRKVTPSPRAEMEV